MNSSPLTSFVATSSEDQQPALKIAPSILAGDFANFKHELDRLNQTTCSYIHLDVMDGHFVDNLTFGAPMVKALRPHTDKVFDVHLMMKEPEKYLDEFIAAGSDIISIHREIKGDVIAILQSIRKAGKRASLAINPNTAIDDIEKYFPYVDQILLMSVHPGFSNQNFIPAVLTKGEEVAAKIRTYCRSYDRSRLADAVQAKCIDLEIDGGVNAENIIPILKSGFNVIVAGGYVFKADDLSVPISRLEQAAASLAGLNV
ncbi:ribulose-phosphate 3-epimerase [Spirochaetota bacterium]|nr:ribulose-phosphate 3-epimerase [Spirochaetota bacterium]